jgi:hypothetical protein
MMRQLYTLGLTVWVPCNIWNDPAAVERRMKPYRRAVKMRDRNAWIFAIPPLHWILKLDDWIARIATPGLFEFLITAGLLEVPYDGCLYSELVLVWPQDWRDSRSSTPSSNHEAR